VSSSNDEADFSENEFEKFIEWILIATERYFSQRIGKIDILTFARLRGISGNVQSLNMGKRKWDLPCMYHHFARGGNGQNNLACYYLQPPTNTCFAVPLVNPRIKR